MPWQSEAGACLRFASIVIALVCASSSALAASYQRTDGSVVDPIRYAWVSTGDSGSPLHPYDGVDLAPAVDLRGADLAWADLREANLVGANLHDTRVTQASLRGADLAGATLGGYMGFGADLAWANLRGVTWRDSSTSEFELGFADLSFADLRGWQADEMGAASASFVQAILEGAYLTIYAPGADFSNALLRDVVFAYIDDTPTSLRDARLRGADLTGTRFTSQFLDHPDEIFDRYRVDLEGADFSGAILRDVVGLGDTIGSARYDGRTDFTNAWADQDGSVPFDPIAAGWTFVPEPSSAVLVGLGLVGLASRHARPRRPAVG
ncbi:MAG: pentapeptide repeat-containing protein [bacterium]|nr:pentapeptide repeat-containing protein [bacterium]